MILSADIIAVLVAGKAWAFDHQLKNVLHIPVKDLHRKGTVRECGKKSFLVLISAGFDKVAAGLRGIRLLDDAVPIAYHHSFPAPFFPEDVGKKPFVFTRMYSIQIIIGAHHCPWISFFHRYFKALQIYFTKSSHPHTGVVLLPVRLLVVCREMLQ